MASSEIASMQQELLEVRKYADLELTGGKNEPKKLTDLSRNMLMIQFPSTEVFNKRMSSITSNSTMTSSSFLPLTKQSSISMGNHIDKKGSMLQLSKSNSYNPFDLALESDGCRDLKNQMLEKMDGSKTNNYIEETYVKWRALYNKALQNKKGFIQCSKSEFYSAFVQNPEEYAKEIFLDPSMCENPCFVLPQLTRENFNKKGLFYRTEKILVQNYYNCFQKYSVDYTKQLLWDVNQEMQVYIGQNHNSQFILKQLLHEQHSDEITLPSLGQKSQDISAIDLHLSKTGGTTSDFNLDFNPANLENMLGGDDLDELEIALASLRAPVSLQRTKSKPANCNYDFMDCEMNDLTCGISNSGNISSLYKNITSYTLRQFKLICYAHKCQLDFILQQIQMAPPSRQNFYIFIEDYVLKERNLRYLFRKISQNYIVQESFQETMQRSHVFSQKQIQKYPYLCDFLLLEFMDSIWINEIYRPHRYNLAQVIKQEIKSVHTLEKFEELSEKKEIFRKAINFIHQTEFNLTSNAEFLAISISESALSGKSNSLGSQSNASQELYEDLSVHVRQSVRQLLKQMQRNSSTVGEFLRMCTFYENFNFHKIQEVEHFYLISKKYYLGKAFANEFGTRLENNKYTKVQAHGSSVGNYLDLNLNQVLPQELVDTFFHQLLRKLLGDEKFKEFLDSAQLLQSLFVLFHIDQASKANFASDINSQLTDCHAQIEDLILSQPELANQSAQNELEESKEGESNSNFMSDRQSLNSYCPFTLIASDEDEDFAQLSVQQQPDLNRGYSDQKREQQKGLRRVIFNAFKALENQFDFKNLIQQQRQIEKKRVMDELQQRIESFNQALQSYQGVDDIGEVDIDDDMLPDPTQLMNSFNGGMRNSNPDPASFNLPTMQRSIGSFSYHISSNQQVNNFK